MDKEDVVLILLEHGADPNIRDDHGKTPLMRAASKGQTNIIQGLLARGADINAVDQDGMTSLMFAVMDGKVDVVKLLVVRGANVNVKTEVGGLTALSLAKSADISSFLKNAGANE